MALSLRKTPAPDVRRLSERQLKGMACAVCGAVLRSTDRPRTIGDPARDWYGHVFTLWACAPVCRRRAPAEPSTPANTRPSDP